MLGTYWKQNAILPEIAHYSKGVLVRHCTKKTE
jgi:hypothetical protein